MTPTPIHDLRLAAAAALASLTLSWTTPTHTRMATSCADSTAWCTPDSVRVVWYQQSPTYLLHAASLRAANPDSLRIYWPTVRAEAAPRVVATLAALIGAMTYVVPDTTGRTWYVQAHDGAGWSCPSNAVPR